MDLFIDWLIDQIKFTPSRRFKHYLCAIKIIPLKNKIQEVNMTQNYQMLVCDNKMKASMIESMTESMTESIIEIVIESMFESMIESLIESMTESMIESYLFCPAFIGSPAPPPSPMKAYKYPSRPNINYRKQKIRNSGSFCTWHKSGLYGQYIPWHILPFGCQVVLHT